MLTTTPLLSSLLDSFVRIMRDVTTAKSRCYGFVTFANKQVSDCDAPVHTHTVLAQAGE